MELRTYQKHAYQLAVNHIANQLASESPSRLLFASPTGTGKSYVEIALMNYFKGLFLISPTEEIIEGLLQKGGDRNRISTPMKLLNRLRNGLELGRLDAFLFDEAHHWLADTWQEIENYIDCDKFIGLTAAPYRGTLKETVEFREEWGNPVWLITYPEAFKQGVIHLPDIQIVPLVNDDVIDVKAGEFVVRQVESNYTSKTSDIEELLRKHAWKKPTIISVSGKEFAYYLQEKIGDLSVVLAETPEKERYVAIDKCLHHNIPIVQIQTIGEGVDYPFEQIIDLSPIFSPVKWVQLLGRIMRVPSTYICTNRNLIRHAYLLQGAIPEAKLVEDKKAFGSYQRQTSRIFTMESLGKFKPVEITTCKGISVSGYFIETYLEGNVVKFAAIYHPLFDQGVYAYKADKVNIDGSRVWGKWTQIAQLPDNTTGFTSVKTGPITEKQRNWWDRAARRHGIELEQEKLTQKEFQILTVMSDLGVRLT